MVNEFIQIFVGEILGKGIGYNINVDKCICIISTNLYIYICCNTISNADKKYMQCQQRYLAILTNTFCKFEDLTKGLTAFVV